MSRRKNIFDAEASWQLKLEQRSWSALPGMSAQESFQIFDDRLALAVSAENPFVNEKREMQCRVLLLGGFERQKSAMQRFLDEHHMQTDVETPMHLMQQGEVSLKFFILNCMDRMLYKNVFSKPSIILIIPEDAEDFKVCCRALSNQTLSTAQTVYYCNPHPLDSDDYREINAMAAERGDELLGADVLLQLSEIVQSGYQSALDGDKSSSRKLEFFTLI